MLVDSHIKPIFKQLITIGTVLYACQQVLLAHTYGTADLGQYGIMNRGKLIQCHCRPGLVSFDAHGWCHNKVNPELAE